MKYTQRYNRRVEEKSTKFDQRMYSMQARLDISFTSYWIKVTLLKKTPAMKRRCLNFFLRFYCDDGNEKLMTLDVTKSATHDTLKK